MDVATRAVESVLYVLRAERGKSVRQLIVQPLRHFLPSVLWKRDEDLPDPHASWPQGI